MSVTLSHGEDSSCVRLEGTIDIGDAADLKTALLAALGPRNTVEVALDGVTGLDVTAVQLLWAAQREAQRVNVALHFSGRVPEAVRAVLADAGLKEHLEFSANG